MAADMATVTMEGEYETVPMLSNGTTYNDLVVTLNLDLKVTV